MSRELPVVEIEPLELPVVGGRSSAMWHALCDLVEVGPVAWTLIGAQMVLLHGVEHGALPPRRSEDIDALVDVRVVSKGTLRFVGALEALGFELEGASPLDVAHRYVKEFVAVDVLAPDGLGAKTDLTTTPPGHTVQVPGGTQALHRTELVPVSHDGRHVLVPRPSLLGAIVIKACAVEVDDVPEDQRVDLAFLLGLVPDPLALKDEMEAKDRQRLQRRKELLNPDHRSWAASAAGPQGHAALELLTS